MYQHAYVVHTLETRHASELPAGRTAAYTLIAFCLAGDDNPKKSVLACLFVWEICLSIGIGFLHIYAGG